MSLQLLQTHVPDLDGSPTADAALLLNGGSQENFQVSIRENVGADVTTFRDEATFSPSVLLLDQCLRTAGCDRRNLGRHFQLQLG